MEALATLPDKNSLPAKFLPIITELEVIDTLPDAEIVENDTPFLYAINELPLYVNP